MTQYKIYSELEELKTAYETTSLEKISGLSRSQHKVIKMCEYYSDSKYLGTYIGNKKQIGTGSIDIPFFNVVNFRVTLAKTATDLDIKDFSVASDNPKHRVESMILNRESYEWMKEAEFSKTLNQMGLNRPKYGGYLVKKNETDGLKIDVVRWTNVFTDQNDILAGTIIEEHHLSPVQLKKKDGVWENVVEVLKAYKKIKAKDRPNTIDVFEMTGEFPVAIFKDAEEVEDITEADEYTYSLQRYFVADVLGKKFLLYHEELSGEMTDYYEYLPWEDNGYGLGRGVIEDSEEAQVWTNDAVINEFIAMTLAGRVGIKTNSKKIGGNVLEHDHGKIYELEDGKDMNSFNLSPAALGQYQNQMNKWKAQGDDASSSYNAATGEQPPSGTPYSQTALLNQVASKPFDYQREVWGIHLVKLFDNWVIPYLVKKIKREHILVSEYSDTELEMIDESFANFNSNKEIVKSLLQGNPVSRENQLTMIDSFKQHIKKDGKRRFIEVPDNYFDGIKAKVTVITTGEQKNKAAILQSLSELLKTVQASYNPNTGEYAALKDQFLSKIVAEIMEIAGSGVSPISVGLGRENATPVSQAPTSAPVPSPMSPPLQTTSLSK